MKGFNEKCYDLLKKVPKGKLTTYKIIAEKLETKAYRAVGNAMNKNKKLISIPCHRVVGINGDLTGYREGIDKKALLLKGEGIEILNNRVINLKKYLYKFD